MGDVDRHWHQAVSGKVIPGHAMAMACLGFANRGRPSPGWEASCKCGWSTTRPNYASAKRAYGEHRAQAQPICKCGTPITVENAGVASPHSCKSCITARAKKWGDDNPSRWERQKRKSHLLKKYGLTPEAYDALLESQGGGCAICGSAFADGRGFRPHVDHCHKSGKVRGVLCGACNMGIGHFGDDADRVRKALTYLEQNA